MNFQKNLPIPVVRVKSQKDAGRCTYALFLDSAMKAESSNSLYKYISKSGLREVAKVGDFLEKIVANTYTKNGAGYSMFFLVPFISTSSSRSWGFNPVALMAMAIVSFSWLEYFL